MSKIFLLQNKKNLNEFVYTYSKNKKDKWLNEYNLIAVINGWNVGVTICK